MTPPTAAPPTVPIGLPPVNTAPATAPAPAPIAVFLFCLDMSAHAVKLSMIAITAVCCTIFFMVFMWYSLVKSFGINRW